LAGLCRAGGGVAGGGENKNVEQNVKARTKRKDQNKT
jgi:hypothetical protein